MAAPRAQGAVQRPGAPRPRVPATRASAAARTSAPRTSTGRTTAPRGTTPRPRTAPARRPAHKRRRTTAPRRSGSARHWLHRLGVVAGATLAIVTALGTLEQPPTEAGQVPTAPTGSAVAAAATLTDAVARHRAALADATRYEEHARQERDAATAAQAEAAAQQAAVGEWVTALYQRSTTERWPPAALSVHDPAATPDVLHAQGLAEHLADERDAQVDRAAEAAVRAAEHTDAADGSADAAATARQRAAAVLTEIRDLVGDLDPAVAAEWAASSTTATSAEQDARNDAALTGWQAYLGALTAAGVSPPAAADLLDPSSLPTGLAPAQDAAGATVPGVAATYATGRTVTVLPAETIAAVSAAFAQLGKPYVPGQAGPDGYGCGGFAAAVWTTAGLGLTSDLAEQWARGTPVAAGQLQVGDLVFATDAATGLDDVGLYVGGTSVLSASADRWQVAVHEVADLSTAVRVTVPAGSPTALPVATTAPATCSAPRPGTAGGDPAPVSGAWGGWSNGQISRDQLCAVGPSHRLRCDAAAAYTAMSAAFETTFGTPLCITDSYRSLDAQADAHHRKPRITAVPGTSNHGWGLAVDLCGGVNVFGTAQTAWMQVNAGHFGWVHPDWAAAGSSNPEPWHWEYGVLA
ncbi:D-alanyl-D-alanine carboxypeptidase family protein [Modestobacter marinus]|uniref:D-alanyl-D-alanine carboxypeptidase family protein n=1 Tax=Modestobacter marinus TaxID=477641 RepID=UPI001C93815B|nr:D-alanyl-D-alanine carboxypeptidase family protein [Modestobacter marinus]